MPREKKANDALAEQRTMEVYHRLVLGDRRLEILQYASTNHWELTPRQVDTYIARANALFKKQAEFKRDRELGKAIERLNFLFMKSLNIKDYRTALSVQKELSALLGLNAPTKIEATVDDASLSDDDRAARIAEILDKARARRDGRAADAAGADASADG